MYDFWTVYTETYENPTVFYKARHLKDLQNYFLNFYFISKNVFSLKCYYNISIYGYQLQIF